ncbi:hypothetical protein [Burkholderia pseudomallei]|nr:hypothetical protein [Burkholderia pseudomallei]EDU06764.1 transposase [Burkholderia pseudomallei 1655]KAA8761019.1 hypothetical protein F5D26_34630 [Burkholderia pseudomallei]KGD11667.1 putative transposase [Burkholderia pseudomallei]KGD49385.1 putative transposase [Burkholderia pseudomallei]MBM5649977.1 hypothetical protein [Burkholderia pseudomallei]
MKIFISRETLIYPARLVIADVAEDVVEDISRNKPTTMKRQMSFAEAESAGKKRVTRRQRFLDEMDKSVFP